MEGLGVQTIEDFWGLELSSKKKKFEWMTEDEEDDLDELDVDRTLELRQACLGADAKDEERNVVQITAENDEGESVKHTILSLRVGGTEQCALFLTLHPPVKFELVAGSGPVHVVGSTVESLNPLFDSDDSSSEDEQEISSPEVKALLNSASKKRPATSPASKPAKQMKLNSGDSASADTSMDTSFTSKSSKTKSQEFEDSEEESDEDEFDEEDSDEDDEDSEDGSEEEEEEVKPLPKKAQTNGKPKLKPGELKAKLFKTPQPIKHASKVQAKQGTQSAPTTPKQRGEKKGAVKGTDNNLDEVKKRLLKQLPNVPKKLEKFNNFVGNSFKIKDNTVKKQLWEFVQKNRPEK